MVEQQCDESVIGMVLDDRYEIVAIAGRGGMGVVYKARHMELNRIVAIKQLRSGVDEASLLRLKVEAKVASQLHHPNAVAVHDFLVGPDGQPFLIMDFVEGESLAQVIAKNGTLSHQRCLPIFIQVCKALAHAHRQGIIHRDIKPSNIFLQDVDGQKDFVKVIDFGIAKMISPPDGQDNQDLTQEGQVIGAPYYMSPEQCKGEELDARSDVYSVGATIYEALLGSPPFKGKTATETVTKQVLEAPRPFEEVRPDANIPASVEHVVMKALAKDKEERFEDILDMKDALDKALAKLPPEKGQQTTPVSEFAGIDILKEIESKEVPVSHIPVQDLKDKGKSTKLLTSSSSSNQSDPEASISLNKSRKAKPLRSSPLPLLIGGVLFLTVVVGAMWHHTKQIEPKANAPQQKSATEKKQAKSSARNKRRH